MTASKQVLFLHAPTAAQETKDSNLWYRLNAASPNVDTAWYAQTGLDDVTMKALLAEETRPRCTPHGAGALLILRGVNSKHGAAPEDMVSVRLWLDHTKIVKFQYRELDVVDEMALEVERNEGPGTPGDFVVALAYRLTDHMEEIIDSVDTALDTLEDQQSERPATQLRQSIAEMRRKIVRLRRFIAPQRDALDVLIAEPFDWQTDLQEKRLKDIVDRITRLVEQLDTMHHRASILQDFIAVSVAERLNGTMLLLSIVAGIFLPLSFVTGLLGMNVAGIPWSDSPLAFLSISIVLIVIGVITFLSLWKLRRE